MSAIIHIHATGIHRANYPRLLIQTLFNLQYKKKSIFKVVN